jgi:hypothetical protein
MGEALWVEYKKPPVWEVDCSPGDAGKMQEASNMGVLSLFPGKHKAKIKGWVTKIQFQRGRLTKE